MGILENWCVNIFETKLGKGNVILEDIDNEFECETYSFEGIIDAGCFSPDNWDIVMRTYIKKRSTP
jgi:hypothetical protein